MRRKKRRVIDSVSYAYQAHGLPENFVQKKKEERKKKGTWIALLLNVEKWHPLYPLTCSAWCFDSWTVPG